MTISQIEDNLKSLVASFNKDSFIYDLLLAYGQPKASIARLKKGGLNLSKVEGEIAWKKNLIFIPVQGESLNERIETLKKEERTKKIGPRFLLVTDYQTLLAFDTKKVESLDCSILEIAKYLDFFLPWAGMEKSQYQVENPADVKAAERMAKLYDEITKDNPTSTPEEVHHLNVFLSRLLFCYFAEDTEIFDVKQFTYAISSHTQDDGSDLNTYLDKLFKVLDTEPNDRKYLPQYLESFPYVNGGLFKREHPAPVFSRRSRNMLIESGELDWSAINPDIFGSMIQAVITPEHRGGLGMHYTSVPNIMKVIEPLFLNELDKELKTANGNSKKLYVLLNRIQKLKIFDPACGSGNFLIIAYKELRKLEMRIFKELNSLALSDINLGNFYGIELDDFAQEVATLSLWLAEHQMNQEFRKTFGRTKPALPLKNTGNIVHGNACRLDWEEVCPKKDGDEIYVLGNPPYKGSSLQSADQKSDMAFVFKSIEGYKNLDYITCWFLIASKYIQNIDAQFAFVSTNSICQGEQVALLWPIIFGKNIEIGFTHTSFEWTNNAKKNAGVFVIIVGLRKYGRKNQKFIYNGEQKIIASNINAYLANGGNVIIEKRPKQISGLPEMTSGIKAGDGGNLILNEEEKNLILRNDPKVAQLIKKYIGADDFMNCKKRFCIWVSDKDIELAYSVPVLNDRFLKCRELRLSSKKAATRKKANFPHEFDENNFRDSESIIIPQTGSERRSYIPIGFTNSGTIISNAARAVYGAPTYLFAVISSKMHLVWVKAVAGRLKFDMQYSNTLCYNTFPFPQISENQKSELTKHVYHIIEERERHSEKTLAELYDPDKMPEGLREAHRQNDLAVERCYRSRPYESDEERLEYLFKLYEQMIAEEKSEGTLFKVERNNKKKAPKRDAN